MRTSTVMCVCASRLFDFSVTRVSVCGCFADSFSRPFFWNCCICDAHFYRIGYFSLRIAGWGGATRAAGARRPPRRAAVRAEHAPAATRLATGPVRYYSVSQSESVALSCSNRAQAATAPALRRRDLRSPLAQLRPRLEARRAGGAVRRRSRHIVDASEFHERAPRAGAGEVRQ